MNHNQYDLPMPPQAKHNIDSKLTKLFCIKKQVSCSLTSSRHKQQEMQSTVTPRLTKLALEAIELPNTLKAVKRAKGNTLIFQKPSSRDELLLTQDFLKILLAELIEYLEFTSSFHS